MKITVIDAGNFKLDGGAMFGVVPKTIWQKLVPADENNLCSWKMRCLLIEDKDRLVLIDSGMGEKQTPKWQNFYFRHGDGDLIKSIRDAGYHENEVTDLLLSHLHFDHCGGAVCWNSTKDGYKLTFPNAKYWTHSSHWESAIKPNPREKATFLSENLQTIKESGQLNFVNQSHNPLGDKFEIIYADGHTEKMLMPIISYNNQKIIFAADTIPSFAHIHVPYCMSYDVRPLQTMDEKSLILDRMVKENILLFFDHDLVNEVAEIELTDRGFKAKNLGKLYEFI
jgi:glyoxylase-like metal-dependent hydrolase (beta-lactamase superfamily II)